MGKHCKYSPLFKGNVFLLLLICGGTLGYLLIDDYSFMDALFMTSNTVLTVGFSEMAPLSVEGEFFTMVLVMVTILSVGYIIANMTDYIASGGVEEKRMRKKLSRKMNKLSGHVIICGHDAFGRNAAEKLTDLGCNVVIIDKDKDKLDVAYHKNKYLLHGDPGLEEVLQSANIGKASALVTVLSKDEENVGVVLSAKAMNSDLRIVSCIWSEDNRKLLLRVGANALFSPKEIMSNKIKEIVLLPGISAFFNALSTYKVGASELGVVCLSKTNCSVLTPDNIARINTKVCIVSVQYRDKRYKFNPSVEELLRNDVSSLLLLGTASNIEQIQLDVLKMN